MNWPNTVTFARLGLCVPCLAAFEVPGYEGVGTAIFLVAALTDWLDGYLARRLNQVSDLGKLMDPLVDKVLVTGALVVLVARGVVPPWSVTVVLSREFLVTGMRALEAQRGVIVPAGWPGKIKAFLQMAALVMLMAWLVPTWRPWLPAWFGAAAMWTYWAAVFMTVYSGAEYVWLGRTLFEEPAKATAATSGPEHP